MNVTNFVSFEFPSLPQNVSFARSSVGAFVAQLECTLDDIEEIKLVVSEAVSNCIIHGYENDTKGKVIIMVSIYDNNSLEIVIDDHGKGIEDIEQALEPTYSSDSNRMGLGFTLMNSFMDELEVTSIPGEGTRVRLSRSFSLANREAYA
ncbi:MAG TPA: anti-sigma F factor [Syntrophomonadaceae bacterium]|nr:anti-sigma F factor [Syntrophomonadaceae bacterium]